MPGGDQPRNQVGGARSRVAEHDGDLPGRLIQALCHVHAAGFVADRYEADAIRIQCGEKRVDLRTWQPEDKLHTLVGYGTGEQLAASYVSHRYCLLANNRA